MATKAMIEKCNRMKTNPKFSTRAYTRCNNCGRPKAVYRKFGICRICFRLMALRGLLAGVRKASW
jgi:small subunit ribosomal protein S14